MIEQLKKYWKFQQGPHFEIGERVSIMDGIWLKLPRKVVAIGWNNTKGEYFYALTGITDKLFLQKDLIDFNYMRGPLWSKKEFQEVAK